MRNETFVPTGISAPGRISTTSSAELTILSAFDNSPWSTGRGCGPRPGWLPGGLGAEKFGFATALGGADGEPAGAGLGANKFGFATALGGADCEPAGAGLGASMIFTERVLSFSSAQAEPAALAT